MGSLAGKVSVKRFVDQFFFVLVDRQARRERRTDAC
jgi:hypothetical protein